MSDRKPHVNGHRISGWGRLFAPGREVFVHDLEEASTDAVLFRGLGRSYGDSAIPPAGNPVVVSTPLADRIRFFDRATGVLRAEAGLSLHELNRLFLRQCWFTPVSPGTQFVTLGGMVAADIHGKNHHVDGCFGNHVRAIKLRVADGRIIECSREIEPELFRATIGGMGLTGHILEVEFTMKRLTSPWIYQESERIPEIDKFILALKESAHDWPMSMGWIDCLSRGNSMGRGILIRGRWATAKEAKDFTPPHLRRLRVPFVFPEWVLGGWSVRAFNLFYYWNHLSRRIKRVVHPEKFFYPLDSIRDWNRIYGPRGFTQYQCVLPETGRSGAAKRFLNLLTEKGGASFLCVIKDCGPQSDAYLSFPMPGVSIALDIAVRDDTQQLIDSLNELVIAEGGRIYLCKDAFTRAEHFRKMEPRLDEWLAIRRKWDPQVRIRSAQSVRLFGDRP